MRRILGLILAAGALHPLTSCSFYRPDAGPETGEMPDSLAAEGPRFRTLADSCIAWYHASNPVAATYDGIHEYDAHLGRFGRGDMEGRITALRFQLARLGGIDVRALPDEDYYDCLVLKGALQAALLDLEHVRGWERNPNFYREVISGGLYAPAALGFDSPDRRMVIAAERLLQVPAVLGAAKDNLTSPPRIYTEIAIDEFNGTHAFLKTGLLDAFKDVTDAPARARFLEARKTALDAVQQFIDWMRKDLLEKSTGAFALGAETFRAKLLYEEGIDTPLEELHRRGTELLRATQQELKKLAGDRPVQSILKETAKDHPPADRLIAETQAMLAGLKQWASGLVDIPPDAACKVQETPEFRRSLSFASMQTPGPFERVARDAYYSVTLPDPAWTPERQEQHLAFFNKYSLPIISVHEAYPGHYTQFLAVQKCRSNVRKVFGCASFAEGWAHYCEQLYVENAPHASDLSTLRLHQLQLALLRICRYLAGIEMHTRGMSYEQAVEFFINEGYLERVQAEREARRGTADPTYLVYTLGKMEILKLRDEYLSRTRRSLKEFHNDLLRHGYPPIPIARKILLGER